MSQQQYQESELRQSSTRRNRKSYSDYFSHDDMLTEYEDDDNKEEELEEEGYEDGSDEEYIQEEQEEASVSGDSSDNDSDDNDSGKKKESNEAGVKDINTKFACGLCSNILSDPYIIPACCHRFCCKCIQESIKAGVGPCPTCHDHSVSFKSLRRDEMMGRLLTRYKMLQEKIQKKHDTEKKRTFKVNEFVQEEIDGRNKPTESRVRKRQKRGSSKNRLNDIKSRSESEAPIQFAGSKKIVATQKGKKQQGQKPSVEFLTFNDRIRCLRDFKQEYGHVNVPKSYGGLGIWCSSMRSIKAGTSNRYKHPDFKLTKERMKVLEEMGFRWTTSPSFDEYFQDLQAYKEKHGHCSVPKDCKENKRLGNWCLRLKMMKSGTQPNTGICKLTPERIKRLEDLGFSWRQRNHRSKKKLESNAVDTSNGNINSAKSTPNIKRKSTLPISNSGNNSDCSYETEESRKTKRQKTDEILTFEERLEIMKKYKEKHGHCNIPGTDESMGQFCKYIRQVKVGSTKQGQLAIYKLTKERIEQLDELGFTWKFDRSFDDYFSALQTFKKQKGHCKVPTSYKTGNCSLGSWVARIRRMKAGTRQHFRSPEAKLTDARIVKLEALGFEWVATFEDYVRDFKAYKEKHGGNIKISTTHMKLKKWVSNIRAIRAGTRQPGISPSLQLTEERIKELDSIGFKWKGWKIFDEYMDELREFKAKYGHCNVPFLYSENKSLSHWVGKIRRKKLGKIVDNGGPDHKLTKERIAQLDKMGFNWRLYKKELYIKKRELRRSPRRRNGKSYSDYFSDDDVLTEHKDDEIEEQEDLGEEYQDGSDDAYIQEEEQDSGDDSSDNDSGKEQESNEDIMKDLNHKFACGICSNILSDPYIIPACCHRFCCTFMKNSIKAGNGPCPTCRDHSVSFQSLRRDEMISRLLTRYKMLQEKIKKKKIEKNRTLDVKGKGETMQTDIDDRSKTTEPPTRKKRKRESSSNENSSETSSSDSKPMKASTQVKSSSGKNVATAPRNKKRKPKSSNDVLTFNERLRCLRDFKKKYGHVNVAKHCEDLSCHEGLGRWCSNIRRIRAGMYKRFKNPEFRLTTKRMGTFYNVPAPTPNFAPNQLPSGCVDSPLGWYDSDGPQYDCEFYGQGSNCESIGDFYENNGKTAKKACCVCGGGLNQDIDDD